MATTRTKNLRLFISDNLSPEAKSNLLTIDRFAEFLVKLEEKHIYVGNSSQEIVEVDTESVGDIEASDVSGLTLKAVREAAFEANSASSTFQITADKKGRITQIAAKPIAITSSQITDFLQAVDDITGVEIELGKPTYVPKSKGAIVLDNSVSPPVLYVSRDKVSADDWIAFRPAPTAVKKKFTLTAEHIEYGYITLTNGDLIRSSVTAYLDRILLFEGPNEDYEITFQENGDVRLVFSAALRDFDYVGEVFRITYWTP